VLQSPSQHMLFSSVLKCDYSLGTKSAKFGLLPQSAGHRRYS